MALDKIGLGPKLGATVMAVAVGGGGTLWVQDRLRADLAASASECQKRIEQERTRTADLYVQKQEFLASEIQREKELRLLLAEIRKN